MESDPHAVQGRRRAVRAVFALAVLALPVQVVVRQVVGEPYPGLYQPSFGGTPPTGRRATTTEADLTLDYADGRSRATSAAELLPPTGILTRSVLARGFGTQARADDPRTVSWLSRRLAHDPRGRVSGLDVRWVEVGYSLDDGSREVLRELRHVHVDLPRPARGRGGVVNRLAAAFDRWVARGDTTPRDLGLYRVLFAALVLLSPPRFAWAAQFPDSFVDAPAGPFALLRGVPPGWFLDGLGLAVGVAAGFLLVGLFTRTASVVLALSMLTGYGIVYSLGKIDHTVFTVLVPLVLALARWGDAVSLDALRRRLRAPAAPPPVSPQWPLRLLALLVGLGFLTAAVPKLLSGWLSPATQAVQGVLFTQYHVHGRTDLLAGTFLHLRNALFWESLDVATVLLEGLLVVAVLNWRAWRTGLAVACLFHLGVLLVMNIAFAGNVVTYAAFAAASRLPLPAVVPTPARARLLLRGGWVVAPLLGAAAALRPEALAVPRLNQLVVLAGAVVAAWYLLHRARSLPGTARHRHDVARLPAGDEAAVRR